MASSSKNQLPIEGARSTHPTFSQGIGPFDPERWYQMSGYNARLIGRLRESPIIVKGSGEDRWWLLGYDAAEDMFKEERVLSETCSRGVE